MTMRRMTGVMFGALLACLALLCAATGRAYADADVGGVRRRREVVRVPA